MGCKGEGKAGDEERDDGDQNEGEGGLLGVTDGTHPDSDPEGCGDELRLGTRGDILHSSCQWFHTYAAPAAFLSNKIHTVMHIPPVVSLINLYTADHDK